MSRYFHECRKHIGRPVKITTVDGHIHRGIIQRVNNTHVFLQPLPQNLGGFGYGFYNPYGYGSGFGRGVALGAIVGLTLLPFFFW